MSALNQFGPKAASTAPTKTGQTVPSRVKSILESDPNNKFRWNLFLEAAEWNGKPITDTVLEDLWMMMNEVHDLNAPDATVAKVVNIIARQDEYHPVKEQYFTTEWDGVQRIAAFFQDFCGTEVDDVHTAEYLAWAARYLFVSAVNRIYQPGCKVKSNLVLMGEQDDGKSRLCRSLFGEFWSAPRVDMTTKEGAIVLQNLWCCELAEASFINRYDPEVVKQYLDDPADNYRSPYGRKTEIHKRHSIFVTTSNSLYPLRDWTGGTRYIPVEVAHIADETITSVRPQLWAEAKRLYDEGYRFWLEKNFPSDTALYATVQKVRKFHAAPDHDADTIMSTIESCGLTEIWNDQIGKRDSIDADKLFPSIRESKVIAILTNLLGWERMKSNTRRGYRAPK
jgi:predicted P-loop ATPase